MKKYFYIIISAIFIISYNNKIKSQNLEFQAYVSSKVVKVGEQFTITYQLNNKVDNINIPSFDNFQLLGGPSVSSSSSIQIINGKVSQETSYGYTYYLRAIKPGKFTIPPATVAWKNKTYQCNTIEIEVVDEKSIQQTPSSNEKKGNTSNITGEKIFVRVHVDKAEAYIGEPITVWIKIYTKLSLSGYDQNFKEPLFPGFYKENVDIPPLTNLERENIEGEIFYTGLLRKFILYPQKSGEINIEPFFIDVVVRKTMRRGDIFDEFFGPMVSDEQMTLKSNSLKLKIKPLPPSPNSFTGGVGRNFNIKSYIDKNIVKTNDAISYKITISGNGNIKLIELPEIKFPSNVESYDPKINFKKTGETSGTKSFEYILIPRYPGKFDLPSIEVSFFDLDKKNYISYKTDSYTIEVEKSPGDTSLIYTGISKEDVKIVGKDIRYIYTKNIKLFKKNDFLFSKSIFYITYLLLSLFLILYIIFRKQAIRKREDIYFIKISRANKIARKRLKYAKKLIKENKTQEFYEEISHALWGYLSDKLLIPIALLNRENVYNELKQKNVDNEQIEKTLKLLDMCEFARFAPINTISTDLQNTYNNSMEIIIELEQQIKY